jgi:hypothetical protein
MSGPTSLAEAREEMRRLMKMMMSANNKFLVREKQVMEFHRQGRQNYSGDLITVMNNDLMLASYSSMSKTMSVLIQGLAAYIQAEIAMKESGHHIAARRAPTTITEF